MIIDHSKKVGGQQKQYHAWLTAQQFVKNASEKHYSLKQSYGKVAQGMNVDVGQGMNMLVKE